MAAGGGSLTTAPLCRGGPSPRPVNHRPSSSRKTGSGRFMGPPPSSTLHPSCSLNSGRQGPPPTHSSSVSSPFVPCDLAKPCGRAAAERNAQNTQDGRVRKYESGTQPGGRDVFLKFVPKTKALFFWVPGIFKRKITFSISSPAQKHSYSPDPLCSITF